MSEICQIRWQEPETRAKEMAMGVVSNLAKYESKQHHEKPFNAYFVLEHSIHRLAHEIFVDEAQVVSSEDVEGEAVALGGIRLRVSRDQASDGTPLGIGYTTRELT